MKALFVIPHYYYASQGRHGSLSHPPEHRALGLRRAITAIHSLFGEGRYFMDIEARKVFRVPERDSVSVIVCTTLGRHLIDELNLDPVLFEHCPTLVEPKKLGMECHAILSDNIGKYDYYCFLEDDLIIHDPLFFQKLAWFNREFGKEFLLQPNRFESVADPKIQRLYVDGNIDKSCTAVYYPEPAPALSLSLLGKTVPFHRPSNPHSGCFFLNNDQMETWKRAPHFLDGDTSFVGPLESAATLGLIKTFKVYKPLSWGFLEIEHHGSAFHQTVLNCFEFG